MISDIELKILSEYEVSKKGCSLFCNKKSGFVNELSNSNILFISINFCSGLSVIIVINSSLVFILYITVWSDVEYGSSYRYLLNIFHLLIPIYLVAIDKFIFSNKTRAS